MVNVTEIAAVHRALSALEQWDMLTLNPDGTGAATADAPWARKLIAAALVVLEQDEWVPLPTQEEAAQFLANYLSDSIDSDREAYMIEGERLLDYLRQ